VVERKISGTTKLLYGAGAFGYGSIGQTVSSFLMFFGTGILGIPGTLMGLAVGISTVWDALTDPFVGHLSDKTKSRYFGKRHGWILFAGAFVAILNLILWSIPRHISIGAKFWLMLVTLLIMETFNTCYSTPYGALGLDLSKNYNDRTAVQNYKTAFSFLSLLVPSILMMFFLKDTRSTQGYINIAIVTSVLCVLCAVICFIGTFKHKTQADEYLTHQLTKTKSVSNIFEEFFSVIKQKNVGRLIVGYSISLSAGAFLTSLGLHVFTYSFGFNTVQISITMICLIAGIIIGQPFWYYVSRKTDKIKALLSALAMLLVCMMVFSCVLCFRNAVPHGVVVAFVCAVICACGIGTGCLYSLPISMYADCVALRQQKTGIDNTGKSAGFLTFCTKISNAVILFVIGLSLDIIGFNGLRSIQSVSVQNWLGWLLICGVTMASTAAMFVYTGYSYTKNDFSDGLQSRHGLGGV
jgi:Na+/melibiose symporter-like transporter